MNTNASTNTPVQSHGLSLQSLNSEPKSPVSANWILYLGFALLAAALIPMTFARYFPSHNGPALLAISHVAKNLHNLHYGYDSYYEEHFYPVPYLAQHGMQWFLDGLIEDRHIPALITVIAIVLRFWSVWYWLGGVSPGSTARRWLCWLVLPWAFEFIVLRGYLNFHMGTSLSLVVYGWHLRHRERWKWWSILVWNCLTLATYFCHTFPVALIGVLITVDETVRSGRFLRVFGLVLRGFVPVLILLACFLVYSQQNSGWNDADTTYRPLWSRLSNFESRLGTPLSNGVRWGWLFVMALSAGLWLIGRRHRYSSQNTVVARSDSGPVRSARAQWAVPSAWIAMLIIYLLCPGSINGWNHSELHILPLVPLMWLGATPVPGAPRQSAIAPILAAAIALIGVVPMTSSLTAYSNEVEEYLEGESEVPRNVPLLSLTVTEQGESSHRVFQPVQWADGYYLIRRGGGLGRGLFQYNTIYPVWFKDYKERGHRQFPPVDERNPTEAQLSEAVQHYGAVILWNVPETTVDKLIDAGFQLQFKKRRLRILVNPRWQQTNALHRRMPTRMQEFNWPLHQPSLYAVTTSLRELAAETDHTLFIATSTKSASTSDFLAPHSSQSLSFTLNGTTL